MNIEIKCFASLAAFAPQSGYIEMPEGAVVADVIARLGIKNEDVKIIFINGVHAEESSPLKRDDRLGLIPAVGGG